MTSFDTTVVAATGLQGALAKTWGQLQVLFENDTVQVVHFINPLTIVPYLESATITTQTAFGLRYVEDFLGMGTVILSSLIPYNEIYSTAKENIIMYYIPMNGEMANEFNLTTDETGYIGTTTDTTTNRLVVERIAASGIQFLVEMAAGVVVAEIDSTPTFGTINVSSSAGTASGDTAITVSGYTQPANETYKYKIANTTAPIVKYGQKLTTGWTTWDGTSNITAATGKKITIASDAKKAFTQLKHKMTQLVAEIMENYIIVILAILLVLNVMVLSIHQSQQQIVMKQNVIMKNNIILILPILKYVSTNKIKLIGMNI